MSKLRQGICSALFAICFSISPVHAEECWLGERFGVKVVDYAALAAPAALDASQCRAACQEDVSNTLRICHKLGAPYINNVEFGCFYRPDGGSSELLIDPPGDFYGCSEICNCPEGTWYEAFRRTCVAPTGTAVPHMPNGDKGGGYYVKDGYLFKDAGQASCQMLPSGEPSRSRVGAETTGQWTPWMNLDQPGGHGDNESLEAYLMSGKACAQPIDIQCRTVAGISWLEANQVYTCQREIGGVCTNHTQKEDEKCLNYEVRFLCP